MPLLVPASALTSFNDPPSMRNHRTDVVARLQRLPLDVRRNLVDISRTDTRAAYQLLAAIDACRVEPKATKGK